MSKILILASSNGNNLKLSNEISEISNELKIETEVLSLMDLNLPLYHTDEEKKGIPPEALQLTEKFENAKGMIFVAPEYNGLIPPVLNNAIAWISRSKEDWRGAFNGKIVAIATHSGGGGAHALIAMRQQLSYIGANVLGRQLLTNYAKPLNHDSAKAVLEELNKLGS